ncbi:extracellular solute-binding protein [Actibacterium sp. 188UL27-1]|uniref:extracellular solute-binding protein n=1 Tax=Actibacterium sp. 188UL27-1 TaxID=2786961 RepID=UPI001958ED2F|nr:extracellular solute-binding protein [Actibacterium sp. 188UL27-1]MBM7069489.1 ABC transporter substrate-binding protein [Actibacterium sp. 188UL27-1]
MGSGLWRRLGISLVASLAVVALPVLADEPKMITSHGISTFGDLELPADFTHLRYVNPDAPKGGEMSVWAFGDYDSMNPYSLKGRSDRLASIMMESLLEGTADEIGAVYGLLAESLTYPEDRSSVVFNLRPEAKFSDGSDLTAEDVLFSYETMATKGLPSFRKVLNERVESAEVLGPHEIKYVFNPDVPKRDVIQMVGGLPVFSKAHYEENNLNLEENFNTPLLGSGAYIPKRVDFKKTSVYQRNPDYWGKDLPISIGRHNFDTLRIEYYGDYNAAFEGFKGGNYLFRNEASSKDWATSYNFPAIERGHVIKAELADGSIATGQGFALNMRRPNLKDPRVREAVSLLFNFEWSNEQLFYGLYARVNSFWENSDLAATGLPTPEELALLEPLADKLPNGVLDEEVESAPTSGNRQLDRRNLRRASALLDEAGWDVGADGLRRKNGKTLRLEFLNDSQTFDRVINPYVENLRSAGIDAVHQRVDNAAATNRERPPAYDFDLVTTFFGQGNVPGAGLKQYFGAETADQSTFNKVGLKSQAVDTLIEHVISATTQEELTTAVRALDRTLRAYHIWVPQWFKNKHTVAYYDVFRHPEELPPYALGNLDFWWYDAERAAELKAAGAF